MGITYDIPLGSTLIWSASGGTISQTGYFVPPSGAGTYTVSVVCSLFPDRKQTATINVALPVVRISPNVVVLVPNRKITFQAITTSGAVTWSVVEPKGGTITPEGLYTAPSNTGVFTVKATSTVDATESAMAKVNVNWSGLGSWGGRTATGISGVSLALNPTMLIMNAGTNYAFQAVVSGTDNIAVNWQVVNTPPDATIDADGVFTASRRGNYQVQVTSVADPSVSVQATVQVNPSVATFNLTPGSGPQAGMQGYSVTALQDGRVLIAGGIPFPQLNAPTDSNGNANYVYSNQAWLYDATTGAFTATGAMLTPRSGHHAVLLNDGRVLMAGGDAQWSDPWVHFLTQPWAQDAPFSEIYDPASGTFQALGMQQIPSPMRPTGGLAFPDAPTLSLAGMMLSTHPGGAVIKLSNGKVLALGGDGSGWWGNLISLGAGYDRGLEGVDLFDPAAGTFDLQRGAPWRKDFGFMVTHQGGLGFGQAPRAENLADGRVLVTPGAGNDLGFGFWYGGGNPAVLSSQGLVADPATMAATATGKFNVPRFAHTLTRLANGKILAVGGKDERQAQEIPLSGGTQFRWATTATAELYDPATNTWTPTGSLNTARAYHAAILLPTGQVQIVGGYKSDLDGTLVFPNTIELYDPDSGTFSVMDHMDYGLSDPKMVLMNDGSVFMTGQIQAPMEPPMGSMNANRSAMSMLMAPGGIVAGSAGFFRTGSFIPGFGPLFMNQGVDRMVATANDHLCSGLDLSSHTWRASVPRITGRNTLFHGNLIPNTKLSSDLVKNLRVDVYLDGVLFLPNVPLEDPDATSWPWHKTKQLGFAFTVPASEAQAGRTIKLKLKDLSGKVIPPDSFKPEHLEYEPKNADNSIQSPWVEAPPNAITIDVIPVVFTYKDVGGSPQTIALSGTSGDNPTGEIGAFANTFRQDLLRLTPWLPGGITVGANGALTMDLGQRVADRQAPTTMSGGPTVTMWAFKDADGQDVPLPADPDPNTDSTKERAKIARRRILSQAWDYLQSPEGGQWGSKRQPNRFATFPFRNQSGVTTSTRTVVWGETDAEGSGDATVFSHFFLAIHDYPWVPVHEFGHTCGLRHPNGDPAHPYFPQYAPYRPGLGATWRIGTVGWDSTLSAESLNSWSWSNPVRMAPTSGLFLYNPLGSEALQVKDIMDYLSPPDATTREHAWISDYSFTKFFFKSKGQEIPNDDVAGGTR